MGQLCRVHLLIDEAYQYGGSNVYGTIANFILVEGILNIITVNVNVALWALSLLLGLRDRSE